MIQSTKSIRPELVAALSAAAWGLFWIPVRALEDQGLEPALVTASQFIVPVTCLIPFVLIRLFGNKPLGLQHFDSGLLIGAAFALYYESLLLTDVVRALILFYIMPTWATLIEILILKRRFTRWRGLALLLGLGGMITILNIDTSFRLFLNLGDAMALASGLFMAFGVTRVRQLPESDVFSQVFAFFFYGAIVSMLLLLIPVTAPSAVPQANLVWRLLPWLILMSVCFLIPIMWGLYWGSKYVDPGRLAILFQFEAIIGIGSAALLTGEPFGIREMTGALLVLSFANTAPCTESELFSTSDLSPEDITFTNSYHKLFARLIQEHAARQTQSQPAKSPVKPTPLNLESAIRKLISCFAKQSWDQERFFPEQTGMNKAISSTCTAFAPFRNGIESNYLLAQSTPKPAVKTV